jgi:transposase-like protein
LTQRGSILDEIQHAKAVKLFIEQDLSQGEVALRLNIPFQALHNWVSLSKAGKLSSVDAKRINVISPIEAEVSRLKKEVAVPREERDILSPESTPKTRRHSSRKSRGEVCL